MDKASIAIVGLGQIGGSAVLSLRRRNIDCRITGIDISAKRLRLLKNELDLASTSWEDAYKSSFIFLCLHYRESMEFLRKAPPQIPILDTCSSKSSILRVANRRGLRFVGGHPLAGNEFAGEKGWREDLFEDTPFFICPGNTASRGDISRVRYWIRALAAKPIPVDPVLHDRSLAATSHFPAVLSLLLKKVTRTVDPLFQGPGYRSMTRLASISPELMRTFLESNRSNMLQVARKLERELKLWISRKGAKDAEFS